MRFPLGIPWIVVALVLAAPSALLAQADPTIGKWKVNLAKSRYEPGPAPKSETRTYEASGKNGVKVRFDRIDAAGKTITVTYDAQYDGKDYPYHGSPDYDTIALAHPNANTVDATMKKNGKAVQTTHSVVSADGKTRVQTQSGTDGQGRKVNNTVTFDRM
jgi:hypothetical protein